MEQPPLSTGVSGHFHYLAPVEIKKTTDGVISGYETVIIYVIFVFDHSIQRQVTQKVFFVPKKFFAFFPVLGRQAS